MKQLPPLLCVSLLALPVTASSNPDPIQAAVASPSRPAADLERDANRHPAEALSFLEIRPGMTVLEVFAGGGYYTTLLDAVVAPDGKVLAHNNPAYLGFVGPEFETRFANGGLPRVERIVAEANEIELEPGSLDATLMVLAYHDFFFGSTEWNWPRVDEQAFLAELCRAMKPGAVLGVVDHVANPGGDTGEVAFRLHRIDPQRVRDDMTGACFDLVDESGVLRNPDDDHKTSAVEAPMKGKTDRFVMKFVRRAGGG